MKNNNNGSSKLYELYLNEVRQTELLTQEMELELATKTRNGDDQAREHFIKANLLLVVKIAQGFGGKGLPILDLINEGNIGLMKAINRFDPARGGKLSTYATPWITRHMIDALDCQVRTVRLPRHIQWCGKVMNKTVDKLRRALEREPTELELATELQVSKDRVAQLRGYTYKQVSIDEPCSKEDPDSVSYHDRMADDRAISPAVLLEKKSMKEVLDSLMKTLSPKEKMVLEYRFGLNDVILTLEAIAKTIPCTKEMIRKIESGAIKKLKLRFAEFDRSKRKLAEVDQFGALEPVNIGRN